MGKEVKLVVEAGSHDRDACPVCFHLEGDTQPCMKDDQGNPIAVQRDGGDIWWIVDNLKAGSSRAYTLDQDDSPIPQGVTLEEKENQVDVLVQGRFLTSYVYDKQYAKPYLGPMVGPYGESYTRLDFTTKEHVHHRSLWFAIGDVNGTDFWNEPEGVHGKQIHQGFGELCSGSVFGRIKAENKWVDAREHPQLDEQRAITIYSCGEKMALLDLEINLKAAYGQVELGATKEAGPLGIRVAESMKVKNGGHMVNSYGAVGESECWGKRANWCDYTGMVGGKELGIAVFDCIDNQDFPTYWHIRDYGLLAPNNFYFLGGKLLKKGDEITYRYRVYFHDGSTEAANVGGHYHDYMNPPKITLAENT